MDPVVVGWPGSRVCLKIGQQLTDTLRQDRHRRPQRDTATGRSTHQTMRLDGALRGGQRMPFWLARAATGAIMRAEDRNPGDRVTMRAMAPTLAQDFEVVAEMNERRDELEQLDVDVLLLGGDQSPHYLKDALTMLEGRMPRARRREFPGLGHSGAWDADPRSNPTGDPDTVAATLTEWLNATGTSTS